MENPAVKWGVYLAVASIALFLIFYLVNPKLIFSVNSYIGIVVTIVMLVMACRESRADSGGFATFGQMFQTSFIVILISTGVGLLFNYIFMNFIDPGLIDLQREIQIEAIEKMSGFLGEERTEAAIIEVENSNPFSIGNVAISGITVAVIGAIISAIIAAIMQKKNPADY